jgi:hypothetical protein
MPNCKYCNQEITWTETNGKNIPLNLDNSQHRCRTKQTTQQTTTLEHSAFNDSEIISALARLLKKEMAK